MDATRLLFATVAYLAFASGLFRANASDAQLERELIAGWAKLEEIDSVRTAIDGTWVRDELEGPHKGTRTGIVRYRGNGQCARVSNETEKVDEVVRNTKYLFVAGRDAQAGGWTLRFVELDLASQNANQLQEQTFLARSIAPTSVVLLGSFPVHQRRPSSLVADPKFRKSRVEVLPDGLARVHYQYDRVVGELDCDPAANYIVRRGRSRHQFQTATGTSQEYIMTHDKQIAPIGPDGQVTVERLVYEVVSQPGGRFKHEITYSYPDASQTGELDEERFRLSAYGLPEPEGIVWEKRRNWLPYWLAGGGALIVLATTLWLRKVRRAHQRGKQP